MVSDALYADYLEHHAAYDRYYKKKIEERNSQKNAEAEELIVRGQEYVQAIRHSNEAIKDVDITAKLNNLEQTVAAIIHEVEINPHYAKKLGLFLNYYLPTTQKLLDAYIHLEENAAGGSEIRKTLDDIIQTIDVINHAFAILLERFYQEQSIEIASEIFALETMMEQQSLRTVK